MAAAVSRAVEVPNRISAVVLFLLGDSPLSEFYVHMPGNHPKEGIQHSEHGKSLKSRIISAVFLLSCNEVRVQF